MSAGITLDKENKKHAWSTKSADADDDDGDYMEHTLFLRHVSTVIRKAGDSFCRDFIPSKVMGHLSVREQPLQNTTVSDFAMSTVLLLASVHVSCGCCQAVLGVDSVADERNVVGLETTGYESMAINQPLFCLVRNKMDMVRPRIRNALRDVNQSTAVSVHS